MKNRLRILATVVLISIGGVVTYVSIPVTDVSQIPNTPVVGIYVTEKASASNVKAVLNEVEKRKQVLYVDSDSEVSAAVKKELKKHSYISEQFRHYTETDPVEHLSKLIERVSGRTDYAILKI